MKRKLKILSVLISLFLIVSISACSATDGEESSSILESGISIGTIQLRVTDPPPADVKTAVVQINNVQVHFVATAPANADNTTASGNTTDSDGSGEWITILDTPTSFDLMEVLGVEAILGSANVSEGKYTQIRLEVEQVTGELTDGTPYTAEVPGDTLKIVTPFTITAGETTILTLDFDGEKSLVMTGNDKFIFKPVVKLLVGGLKKQEKEMEMELEQEEGEDAGDEPELENEKEQGADEEKLTGTIDSINGTSWQMTIDGTIITVDVSNAEIKGNPAEGSTALIQGMTVDSVFIADEVTVQGNN